MEGLLTLFPLDLVIAHNCKSEVHIDQWKRRQKPDEAVTYWKAVPQRSPVNSLSVSKITNVSRNLEGGVLLLSWGEYLTANVYFKVTYLLSSLSEYNWENTSHSVYI